jgi:TPR repeat protein
MLVKFKLVDSNHAKAIYQLGVLYSNGDDNCNIEKDMGKAVKLLQRAAELGYAPAYCNLGVILKEGDIVSRDEAEVRQYYEKVLWEET